MTSTKGYFIDIEKGTVSTAEKHDEEVREEYAKRVAKLLCIGCSSADNLGTAKCENCHERVFNDNVLGFLKCKLEEDNDD